MSNERGCRTMLLGRRATLVDWMHRSVLLDRRSMVPAFDGGSNVQRSRCTESWWPRSSLSLVLILLGMHLRETRRKFITNKDYTFSPSLMVNQTLCSKNAKFDMLKLPKNTLSNKRLIALLGDWIHRDCRSYIKLSAISKARTEMEVSKAKRTNYRFVNDEGKP